VCERCARHRTTVEPSMALVALPLPFDACAGCLTQSRSASTAMKAIMSSSIVRFIIAGPQDYGRFCLYGVHNFRREPVAKPRRFVFPLAASAVAGPRDGIGHALDYTLHSFGRPGGAATRYEPQGPRSHQYRLSLSQRYNPATTLALPAPAARSLVGWRDHSE